ncbi:MAG: hypothetical protein COA78_36795 [Blastopirellula sp.]|nr:MAG: hypothetical protein COA78_36795 [Blastopirellula sp.]
MNAWDVLTPALRGDAQSIKSDVDSGRAELMNWGGEFFTVTRSEETSRGTEMVLIAAAGKNAVKWCTEIEQVAKRAGYSSIRYHTQHAGLNRLVKSLNFQLLERVYQKDI